MKIDFRYVGRKFNECVNEVLFMVLGMTLMLSMIANRSKIGDNYSFFWGSVLAFILLWLLLREAIRVIETLTLRKEEPPK